MFQEIRKLASHSFIYGFFNSLMRAVGLILLPLYTRYLSPERYGILELLIVTSYIITLFFGFGLNSAIVRYCAFYQEEHKRQGIVSSALIFLTVICSILVTFLFLISSKVSRIIFGYRSFSILFDILLIWIFFQTLSTIPLALLRAKGYPLRFSLVLLSGAIFKLLLNIYFLAVLKLEIRGILIGNTIASAIVLAGGLINTKSYLKLKLFSFEVLKKLLFFGTPLSPSALAFQVLSISDRFFLQRLASLQELGLYSVGYKVGLIMEFIVMSFQMAWGPIMFSVANKSDAKLIYSKVFTYYSIFFLFFSLAISVYAEEVISLLTVPQYFSAYKVVPVISLSYVLHGYYFVTAVGINLRNKTYYFPIIMGVSALVNLILNYFLIPSFGMMGAASATLISFLILLKGVYFISNKLYPISYKFTKVFKLFAYWIFINIVVSTLPSLPSCLTIVLKFCFISLFIFLSYAILNTEERERIREILRISLWIRRN